MIVIAAFDYSFGGSSLVGRAEWTFADGVFWAAISYVCGQVLAGPSSLLLEHGLARHALAKPTVVQLGQEKPGRAAYCFAALSGALREYSPLPEPIRASILAKVGASSDPEVIFEMTFPVARGITDTATRLDNFLNLYGMCRNVSFALLVSAGALSVRQWISPTERTAFLLIGALVVSALMFGRFLKFYSAYSREVLRTYSR